MGDRTSFQVYVYDCPEDQRAAVAEVLAGLAIDWADACDADAQTGTDTPLNLAEPYTDHEISCGAAQEYAANLIEAAPGCSFVLWEDPKYEWLGDVRAYTPGLGEFAAECTAAGEPAYTRGQIISMMREASSGEDVFRFMERKTGKPWFDHWHAAGALHESTAGS